MAVDHSWFNFWVNWIQAWNPLVWKRPNKCVCVCDLQQWANLKNQSLWWQLRCIYVAAAVFLSHMPHMLLQVSINVQDNRLPCCLTPASPQPKTHTCAHVHTCLTSISHFGLFRCFAVEVRTLKDRKCAEKAAVASRRMRAVWFVFICGDGPAVFLEDSCFFLRKFQVPAVFPSPCSQPVKARPLPLPPSYSEPLIARKWEAVWRSWCAYVW